MRSSGKEPQPHLFTLDEASALLPRLRDLLEAMQGQEAALDALREELSRLRQTIRQNGNAAHLETLSRKATDLESGLRTGLEQIQAWGVEVKDISQGLVDFPYRRGGRIVYLCWRLGEDHIGWWHEISAGFAGRQPIATL
jgi:hypothetical protein